MHKSFKNLAEIYNLALREGLEGRFLEVANVQKVNLFMISHLLLPTIYFQELLPFRMPFWTSLDGTPRFRESCIFARVLQ